MPGLIGSAIDQSNWRERFAYLSGRSADEAAVKTEDQAHRYLLKLDEMRNAQAGPSKPSTTEATIRKTDYNPETYRPPR